MTIDRPNDEQQRRKEVAEILEHYRELDAGDQVAVIGLVVALLDASREPPMVQ